MVDEIPSIVEWRTIDGFPDYEVSSDGRVRRIAQPAGNRYKARPIPYEVTPSPNHGGYLGIYLYAGKKRRYFLVSRLVCASFKGPAPSSEHQAAHDDGNKENNSAGNLRWATCIENQDDMRRHGTRHIKRGVMNDRAKLTEEDVRAIRAVGVYKRGDHAKLARQYGVTRASISFVIAGKIWKHVS